MSHTVLFPYIHPGTAVVFSPHRHFSGKALHITYLLSAACAGEKNIHTAITVNIKEMLMILLFTVITVFYKSILKKLFAGILTPP